MAVSKEVIVMAEMYSVKVENGSAKLYKQDGAPARTLCGGAQSAVVKGQEVHVTMAGGKVKVYDVRGFYRGTR